MSQLAMHQDVSTRRQQELLTELIELIRNRDATRQELDQTWRDLSERCRNKFSAQRQETVFKLQQEHDGRLADYQQQLAANRTECETQLRLVTVELEEKLEAAAQQRKTAISDGEYDWFLAKQRLRKEYEADQQVTVEQHARQKGVIRQHRQNYRELCETTAAVLARHRCDLTVRGGDLLEEPDDSDHRTAHLQTFSQIQELVRQFRRSFWVRCVEERWFLIVFLTTAVVLVIPAGMVLGRRVLATAIVTTGAALLASLTAWQFSRTLAHKTAFQFLKPLTRAVTTGKQQLLAARRQAKRQTQARLDSLSHQCHQRLRDIDQQWQQTLENINQRNEHRQHELRSWADKRSDAIGQQLTSTQAQLAARADPMLSRLQEELRQARQVLDQNESSELAQLRVEHDARFQKHAQHWIDGVAQVSAEAARMRDVSVTGQLELTAIDAEHWAPATAPASAIRFGEITVELDQLPGGLDSDRRLRTDATDITLPAALDLIHCPSLLIELGATGHDLAGSTMRTIMLRMLTVMPSGKLRFTIIDPVGLGQNFSAFMHLADHDEQLVGHRIWTESRHIQQRLVDLTQHIENVIQTYLRNEFTSIQDYNRHAGEVAEPFHVLVVANFPAGFSAEAAQRLLSIASSGPRCGVYMLISIDAKQTLPRNFDLAELRRHANVLVVDGEALRWADLPLRDFPIRVDALPSESKISELLHAVGRHAHTANRVEVPFSTVAPDPSEWWTGDSRSEISVPLGRAGATKIQSLRLGRGTSQHVLISGKTGSGKSTLLHAMITNLALRYSPQEVQFYLVDFKKGVEFKPYAEYRLPHARVIAIESEREFGLSVLQRLDVELRRRGDLFRRVGVQGLAGYRDARPDERMPRILLIIDEFQEFFVKEDKISQDASLLLDRLVRQGRAFGIHVLLGSQTLAGAYSLARATSGQMAVRIALQCSASDAHLILSDDNDAARLLHRPGEAIYNDANGLVEGNHPFQVVWLPGVEQEHYLRELQVRGQAADPAQDAAIVFEGNVAAQLSRNDLLRKAWEAPAPRGIPLAPRAWVGEAIAIKEAPAVVFHRRSGSNLMLVGQQAEAALGVLASCLLGLASFSPIAAAGKPSRFVVLDGTRPESSEAAYWSQLRETTGIELSIIKPRDAARVIAELALEVHRRQQEEDDESAATFLLVYDLARFRELRKSDDDFGLGSFDNGKSASPAEQLASILRDGPHHGVHTLLWCDTHTNLLRWLDRQSLRDVEARVLFQMSATDSSHLMDSSAAAQLGTHRAILYSEDQGRAERFRPYGLPQDEFLLRVRSLVAGRNRDAQESHV